MKCFSTSTLIQASPETIWNILVDGRSWLKWNPTVTKIDGTIAPGETVKVHTKINPDRVFAIKVSEFVPYERMVWTGSMPFGLFKGERIYSLSRHADGSVKFSMRESFSGLMAALIAQSIPDLQPAFDEFAAALKQRAEETN